MIDTVAQHVVDLTGYSREEQLAMAQAALPEGWEISELPGGKPPIGGITQFFHIGEILAVRLRHTFCRLTRRGHASETGTLRIRLMTEGRIDGIVNGTPYSMKVGDLTIEALQADFALECENFGCDVVAFPALTVNFDPSKHDSFTLVDRETPVGRMLAPAMRSYFEMLPDGSPKDINDATALLAPLVASALSVAEREDTGKTDLRTRQLVAMKTFIEHHLENPKMGADMLVSEFPISRAAAYRLFKNDGGLLRYIQGRRLARAAHMLTFANRGTSVGDIAKKVGLPNVSHFSRLFKEKYGISPSQARDGAVG